MAYHYLIDIHESGEHHHFLAILHVLVDLDHLDHLGRVLSNLSNSSNSSKAYFLTTLYKVTAKSVSLLCRYSIALAAIPSAT
jgi:hypothetical protein